MAYELTKEFVAKLVNQPITDFEVSAGANQADNVAGELKAIKVQTAPGDTLHLVHKTFPADPMGKAFIADAGGFRIENLFYSEVAPTIENLIKGRNPVNYKLPIPKYYAGFNNDNDDYVTLEDLRPQGFRMADKFKGLNLAETTLLLQQLGRFHAFTYFLLKHEGEKYLDAYPYIRQLKFMQPEKMPEMMMMIEGTAKYSQEIVAAKNPEYGKRYADKMAKLNAPEVFAQTTKGTDTLYFPVLIHGDIWLNNAMFKYDAQGNPTEVKFIDFQMTRRGNIFEDLKYFFYTSTTPEFRKKHLYQALEAYYNAFVGTLADIKCPVPIGFSRGFLIDNYDENRFSGYVFMGFALPMQLGDNPKLAASMDMPQGGGPPCVSNGGGAPPPGGPPQLPPGFNPLDIPVEIRIPAFVGNLRMQLESSPRALERLMDITQEMIDLKLM